MNTLKTSLIVLASLMAAALSALSAEIVPGVVAEPAKPTKTVVYEAPSEGKLYADAGVRLNTPNFKDGTWGYFVGVGYQASPVWSIDGRLGHGGLDAEGHAIQDLGARVVARLPFKTFSPYTFLGASFSLENDLWRLQPGAGIEFGVSERLKGLSIFAEGGMDADLKGKNGYLFGSGIRLRF
jgi:hypothetical protein